MFSSLRTYVALPTVPGNATVPRWDLDLASLTWMPPAASISWEETSMSTSIEGIPCEATHISGLARQVFINLLNYTHPCILHRVARTRQRAGPSRLFIYSHAKEAQRRTCRTKTALTLRLLAGSIGISVLSRDSGLGTGSEQLNEFMS